MMCLLYIYFRSITQQRPKIFLRQKMHLPLFHLPLLSSKHLANYFALASLCLTNWTVNPCADPFIFPHGSQRLIYLHWWRCASAKSNPVNHRPLLRRFHHFINLRYHYGRWWHNSEQWYTLKILICTLQQRASLSLADLATAYFTPLIYIGSVSRADLASVTER